MNKWIVPKEIHRLNFCISEKTKSLSSFKNLFFKDLYYLHSINLWIYSLKNDLIHNWIDHSYELNKLCDYFI